MTNKEVAEKYKNVMLSLEIPEDVKSDMKNNVIGKVTLNTYKKQNKDKYLHAIFALTGIAALAAGISAVTLANKIIKAN